MATDRLIIFDTTLRDGEQSPGAAMTQADKVRIAKALERLRVDVIEAGFPIASPGDFEAVRAVARLIKDCTVCGLARTSFDDIGRAAEALKDARSMRSHTLTDSQGEVTVRLAHGGRIVNGHGADTDIIVASVKAHVNALNRILYPVHREHPQASGSA